MLTEYHSKRKKEKKEKKRNKNDDPKKEKYIVGSRITGTINYRKLKWNSHINERKSEDNMANNVTNKFSKGSLYAFGDYAQYNRLAINFLPRQKIYREVLGHKSNMKYQDPTKGKGFRNLFVRRELNIALCSGRQFVDPNMRAGSLPTTRFSR